MRIDYLKVKHFRCFDEREFTLAPHFNVLIGDNGSGKTAILEALSIAAGSWLLGLKGCRSQIIRPDDVRLVPYRVGEELTFEEQYPVEVYATGIVQDQKRSWLRSLNTRNGRTTFGRAESITKLSKEADAQIRAGETVTLPIIAYYGTSRLWYSPVSPDIRSEYSNRELSRYVGYRDSTHERINARELTQWMERQDRIAYQERREPELYSAVRQAIRQAIEGAADARFDNRRLEIVIEFKNGSVQPFGHLSDGQRNIVALIGDIALRMARLNPHFGKAVLSQTPGIVLIDELDLHLHPNWQRCIVEDLRQTFPLVQFVATTHSPFIIQTLREGELLMLAGQPVPQLSNLSLEDIAEGLMQVPDTDVSPRYRAMVNTAKEYLQTLDRAAQAPKEKLQAFEQRLADQITPYADNPAFQAYLELKRATKLGQ